MDWNSSYSAEWRVYRVNRDTWADREQVANVDSVSLTRTANGNLLESGSMEVTGTFEPDYYRIVMIAEQGGETERVNLCTLLFDVKGGNTGHGTTTQTPNGYSVLYPASTTAVLPGQYAPAGVDGAQYAAQLLSGAINAPVQVEGSFTLNDHIVHEIGAGVLDAVWSVLDAGGYILQIDGYGVVHIMPKPTQPSLVITSNNAVLTDNNIAFVEDTSKIPNRYIVIDGNSETRVSNDDPNSRVSTVVRGFYVDQVDDSPTPINGETYAAYARRMLEQASTLKDERTYTREFAPGVLIYSLVSASLSDMNGEYRVLSQNLSCGNGITVSEKATKEVKLWNMAQ